MAQFCFFTVVVLVFACLSQTSGSGYNCPYPFGYHGDANDCSKFYRCVYGYSYAFYCPVGTRWSSGKLACDYAYNVPCYGYDSAHVSHSYGSYGYGTPGYTSYSTGHQGYGGSTSYGNAYGYSQPSSYGSYTSYGHGYPSSSYYSNGNSYGTGYHRK